MTDADASLRRLAEMLRAMDPADRTAHLAELAQVDPDQVRLVMQWLDTGRFEPTTTAGLAVDDDTAPTQHPNDQEVGLDRYLKRRAALLEQVWFGRQLGNYRVETVLGQGGMGIVLGAVAEDTGQQVAIKMVRPDLMGPGLDMRLTRESEAMARLQHPGIARFLGLGTTQEGRPFLVMERVDGAGLDTASSTLDLKASMQLLAKVCAVVSYAHTHQVVHRDLKPSNILVQRDGEVRLLDFGIAKCLADQAHLTRTQTAERMLTPRYAAPEQVRGETSGPPADVHALGVMLVDMASRAMERERIAVSLPSSDPPAVPATGPRWQEPQPADPSVLIDPALRAIAAVALANHAEDRYADAGQLGDDLTRWCEGRQPLVLHWRRRLQRRWRSRRSGLLPLAVACALLIAAACFAWYQFVFLERSFESGYGLIERDLAGLSRSQKKSVREAFRLDAGGDRTNAIGLMQVVADSDIPTALPPVMMSIWLGARGEESAERYRKRVETLLADNSHPYLALFYEAHKRDDDSVTQRQALESALALRPLAWKLRFALAHGAIAENDARRARAELAKIDFVDFQDRRVPQVLADRALLGDCDAVRPMLPKLPADRPAWRTWVEAACDFAEGRYAEAGDGFDLILSDPDASQQAATVDVVRSARLVALGQEGQWLELLDAAAEGYRRAVGQNDRYSAHRDAMMALVAAHRLGLQPDIETWRERVLSAPDLQYQVDAHVAVRLLGLPSRFPLPALRADVAAKMGPFPGLSLLLEAIEHQQSGRRDAALAALSRARREGLAETRFAPVLIALERSHNAGQAGEPLLLWFAPWSDWVAQWVVPTGRSMDWSNGSEIDD